MQQMFKNPIILGLALAVLLVFGIGVYYSYEEGKKASAALKAGNDIQKNLKDLKEKLELLKTEKQNKPIAEKTTDKVIYKTNEPGVGAEASFAPLFDVFLSIAKTSGIRIRSISYNYSPAGDPIVAAGLSNYNVCELDIKAVGSYRNFQSFFRAVAKEPYLMGLTSTSVEPWENDRTVLIGNVKLNLYTKTN